MVATSYVIEKSTKPVIAGLISVALTRYTYGLKDGVTNFKAPIQTVIPLLSKLNGTSINIPLFTGLAIGTASFVADIVTDLLMPFVSRQQMLTTPLSAVTQLGAVAGASIGMHYILNTKSPGRRGFFNITGIAIASELASSYVYHSFIEPILDDANVE